jgi:hypothetical protein
VVYKINKFIKMKITFMLTIALAGCFGGKLSAQPDESLNREKMKLFSYWIGRWQGEGFMQMGPGDPKKSVVDERIESKLDGTLLLVEGIGKAKTSSSSEMAIVHQALGILSYDPATNQFRFRTYLKDGREADAWLMSTGQDKFQWGFDTPNGGKTRYSITLNPNQKTWNEIGEFSRDGSTWLKFFEMNLKKTE